ncbi:MAG: hypothetical protein MJ138_04250, partial [Kiritimatiellae bacterium]|nr:hypothetical protein [Kiritimatiellia bacterium]
MRRAVAIFVLSAAACATATPFSTLRLPATPENWPSQRAMLSRSRDCFDEVWFSACNFKSLAENEARAKWLAAAAREIRAMGYVASLEFELTIGNTDGPDYERMPFKDWTGFTGPDGWEGVRCNCPRDPKFHAYFRDQLRHYCAWKPHTIWLDDDVRVESHGKNPNGCYCKRCVAAFAEAEGRAWTRETLVAATKTDKALAARWRAHCFRGLAEFAYAFCKAVKEFSPETRLGFQYPWADEGQLAIVEAMAKAAGGKIAMRPGSCHYNDWNPYGLVDKTYRMQEQMKTLSARFGLFDRLCPEIETYPRNFTMRTARSLGFEALMHLAAGMDSLTWYVAGNAEPCEWYERTVFKAPRANMWLYREYVARNRGADPVGFAAFPHEIGPWTPGLDPWAAPSCVPYNFGVGRALGTVLWDCAALHAVPDDALREVLRGGVLADQAAVRHLVGRKLVPEDAAELDKTELSDSTERHARLVALPSGGKMAVFARLSPYGATSRELLRYSQLADAVSGGGMPVVFESPALDVVLPRVRKDGSFASAVIVNARIDEQESARLRIRRLEGDCVLWFALWSDGPVRLPVTRDAKT